MKKNHALILAGITAAFCLFTFGFFLGRSTARPSVITSTLTSSHEVVTPATFPAVPKATAPQPAYPININTADVQTLTYLPGIGEVIAQRIVDYREANGNYAAPADLLQVKGIGQTRLDEILPYITTGQQEESQ